MKKKPRSKKKNGDYNKGQGIVIIIIIIVLIKILTKCDFDEITNKNKSWQPQEKKPAICENLKLSKSECLEKLRKEITESITKIPDLGDIKEKYSCMQKDASNVETAKWTLSINRISYKSFFVEHSSYPDKGKKFAIYDDDNAKLKWFDLIDKDLYFDSLELSDNKVKHKKFSIELEAEDYKRFNKLYKNTENAKVDESLSEIREGEKFYYSANVFFREGMKDTNNFLSLFDVDCEAVKQNKVNEHK
tara:strand:- start:65 stop:805 length:741 start_codon:yes stop_codon:yes gene_type:complete